MLNLDHFKESANCFIKRFPNQWAGVRWCLAAVLAIGTTVEVIQHIEDLNQALQEASTPKVTATRFVKTPEGIFPPVISQLSPPPAPNSLRSEFFPSGATPTALISKIAPTKTPTPSPSPPPRS